MPAASYNNLIFYSKVTVNSELIKSYVLYTGKVHTTSSKDKVSVIYVPGMFKVRTKDIEIYRQITSNIESSLYRYLSL